MTPDNTPAPVPPAAIDAEVVERAYRVFQEAWCDTDGDDYTPTRKDVRKALAAAGYAELRAIVDKLPKTADGVPIVPGMKLWVPPFDEIEKDGSTYRHDAMWEGPVSDRHIVYGGATWMQGPIPLTETLFYSTREAAEAAALKGPR